MFPFNNSTGFATRRGKVTALGITIKTESPYYLPKFRLINMQFGKAYSVQFVPFRYQTCYIWKRAR